MKSKIGEQLNQELSHVQVSPELHKRILNSAHMERHYRRRHRYSYISAIAAILVITLAVVSGLQFVHRPVEDKKASPNDYTAVWMDEVNRTYHARRNCEDTMMTVASLAEARARGYSPCEKCIRVQKTAKPQATVEPTRVPEEAEITPVPTEETAVLPTASNVQEALSTPVATEIPENVEVPVPTQPAEIAFALSTEEPADEISEEDIVYLPADEISEELVYLSDDESTFHTDSTHVSEHAESVTRAAALLQGSRPCQECNADENVYWMTDGGEWFHSAQNCQNMSGAYEAGALYAFENGKTACPICIGQDAVWMTDSGVWYHDAEYCQNMVGAKQVAKSVAEASGKERCPYCYVSADDPAWMETISGGICTLLHAYESDGTLIVYCSGEYWEWPLYGNPVENISQEDAAQALQSLLGEHMNSYRINAAAQEIADGSEIGIRTIDYQINALHAYDAEGEIPLETVQSYYEPYSDVETVSICNTGSRTPTRVSVELSLTGISCYLDSDGEWQYEEVPYDFEMQVDATDTENALCYLYITGSGEAAECELTDEVQTIQHVGYSTVNGCSIDAYSRNNSGEYDLAIVSGDTVNASSLSNPEAWLEKLQETWDLSTEDLGNEYNLFELMYESYTGDAATRYEAIGETSQETKVLRLETSVSDATLMSIAVDVQTLLAGNGEGLSLTRSEVGIELNEIKLNENNSAEPEVDEDSASIQAGVESEE